jgi:hypothetical protein
MKLPKEDYTARREAKKERYQELYIKKKKESNEIFERAKEMADVIPFGQPILVGHHSEKGDRSYRTKIDNKFRKSFEVNSIAKHYEDKVKSMEHNHAISQDDPEAVQKIKLKIAELEEDQKKWRAVKVNKDAKSCFDLDSQNWKSVQLNSISSEIRRLKKRLDALVKLDQVKEIKEEKNGISFEVNKSENRVMIFFPGKPSEEVRKDLKSHGFRWSPTNMAWQAFISEYTINTARRIME